MLHRQVAAVGLGCHHRAINDEVQVHFVARSFDELGQTPCGLSRPLLARSTLVARFQPQEPGKKGVNWNNQSFAAIEEETAQPKTESNWAHETKTNSQAKLGSKTNR